MQPALYRAERPEVFEEIIGQKHIVRILQNQIRTGTVSQAYLFA
jgi:DNA polymerase III gamma/tau subunit